MELTINIKEESKLAFFVKLLQEFSFVEIVAINDHESSMPLEHAVELKKRLERIELGQVSFRSWDIIKTQYEKN